MSVDSRVVVERSPPFATITEDDHSAWIIITTAIGIPWIILFGSVRLLFGRETRFVTDAILFVLACTFALIQSCLILGACAAGLGKSVDIISVTTLHRTERLYYGSNLFLILTLGLSKASVATLLIRLGGLTYHAKHFDAGVVTIACWTLGSLGAVIFPCRGSTPWKLVGGKCSNSGLRLWLICSLDIITEIVVALMACMLVVRLKMPLKRKSRVLAIFTFRLLIILPIVFRAATFSQKDYTVDPLLREKSSIIWTQVEMICSIIVATLPTLRIFLQDLSTNASTTTSSSNNAVSYALSSLRSKRATGAQKRTEEDISGTHSQDPVGRRGSTSSSDHQQLIQKDVTWGVAFEEADGSLEDTSHKS